MTDEESDRRWDIHTERQIGAAKAGITAVTVLNSGSWLALLSQADKLAAYVKLHEKSDPSPVFLAWGLGAFFGTVNWLFVYLSTYFQMQHDFDRKNPLYTRLLSFNQVVGILTTIASVSCFLWGVIALSSVFR